MEECDTGLRMLVSQSCIWRSWTYTEDQEAADNGGVLGGGGLIVDGAHEALLGATIVGDDDTVGGHFCG